MKPAPRVPNQFAMSAFWFAWEVHWSALLGAAIQCQVARFVPTSTTGTAVGILLGTGAFLSIVAQFGAGRASDRAGKRIPFIIAGTLLDIIALFGFALSPSFGAAVASFVGVQIALNIAGGPYQALIPDRVPQRRQGGASAVMGFYRLAGTAAGLLVAKLIVVQPTQGNALAVSHGLLVLAAVLSIMLLVALAITVFGVRDVSADPSAVPPTSAPGPWPQRASFVALIVSRSLVSMGLYLILPFLGFFLRDALHVTQYLHQALDLLLVMVGFSLVGTLPAGVLSDRVSKKLVMTIALLLLAAGAFVLSRLTGDQGLLLLAALLGIGWGAYYSVDWALACNLLPAGRAGALMALWNIGASGPQVLSPAIGGILVDRVGAAAHDPGAGYRALFALVAVYVIAGIVALAFVREPAARAERESGG